MFLSGPSHAAAALRFFFTLGLLLALASCGPGDTDASREAVRDRVESFFAALEEGDTETLARIAPDLQLDSEAVELLKSSLAETGASYELEEVRVDGRSAVASVLLSRSRGDNTNQQVTLLVPLSWDGGSWSVEPSITVEQRFDFVPLEE